MCKLWFMEIKVKLQEQEFSRNAAERRKEIQRICWQFKVAETKFNEKEFGKAKVLLDQVKASKVEDKCYDNSIALLRECNKILAKKVTGYYKKGYKCYLKEQYNCALREWNQVLSVLPEHDKAKPLYEQILPIQVKKAQDLYREGLTYEGLNDINTAKVKWTQSIQQLPLPQHEYYQKAKNKLNKYN